MEIRLGTGLQEKEGPEVWSANRVQGQLKTRWVRTTKRFGTFIRSYFSGVKDCLSFPSFTYRYKISKFRGFNFRRLSACATKFK
jgi:hypothetical protein